MAHNPVTNTKTIFVCNKGVRATITVVEPPALVASLSDVYQGILMIHSNLGSWGATWSSCPVPFTQHLKTMTLTQLIQKLMKRKAYVFDPQATREIFQAAVLPHLSCTCARGEAMKVMFQEFLQIQDAALECQYAWMRELTDLRDNLSPAIYENLQGFLDFPDEFVGTKLNEDFQTCYSTIWDEFLTALEE